jgi:hypothetical protein
MKYIPITIIFIVLAVAPCFAQWQIDSGLYQCQMLAFGAVDTNFFASLANVQFQRGDSNELLRRTPWTSSGWTECDMNHEVSAGGGVTSIASLGHYIFVANGGGIIQTTDLGQTWIGVGKDSIGAWINGGYSLGVIGSTVLSGGWRSTDSGAIGTWRLDSATTNYASMVTMGSYLIGGANYGTWRSTDNGLHWTNTSNFNSTSFAIIDTTIFAAGDGLQRSTDSGATWSVVDGRSELAIATDGKNLFAGTFDTGVLVSTDLGASWRAVNEGIRNNGSQHWVGALAVFDTLLYANFSGSRGNPNTRDWFTCHRPISEMVDSTASVVEQIPVGDSIEIYPNPASGIVTIISGGTSIFGVSVLNVLGEDVLDMPSLREADISLDLSKLPAGTYFFKIQTSSGTQLRKITIER